MTSEARRRANQRNARNSTGPRSPEGKARASRNAVRYGLNIPVIAVPAWRGFIAATTDALLDLSELPRDQAQRIAELLAHLARIREAKCAAIARDQARPERKEICGHADLEGRAILAALPELLILDGYERKARSRLRRALRDL